MVSRRPFLGGRREEVQENMRAELRRDTPRGLLVRRIAPRVALLALLWWALNGDNAGSWWVGAPAIAAAALSPRAGPSPTLLGTLRFVPFFLRQSLVGGADVALRALRPSLPLAPDFLEYRLRLPMGPPSAVMAATVSLLPGTLTAEIREGTLRVHTLTEGQAVERDLRELEFRVAGLFGLGTEPATSPDRKERP